MKYGILFVVVMTIFPLFSQKEKPWNYRRYDQRMIHFGFMLGFNNSGFNAITKLNAYENYGLKSLVIKSQPGGQVGIVTTMKLFTPVIRLRFIPTLSFQERVIQYSFINPNPLAKSDILDEERIGSTNLDFPLMLQFRTLRYNNFTSYLLCGWQPTIDLQSQEKASQNYIDPFVKIKKNDMQGQVGGGIEFFAPYFKFGIELKYSQSFQNSFIQDFTPVSKPLDALYNRVWWVSFIFEG
jgi:hypothetical protein